jgi:hypothetical protein
MEIDYTQVALLIGALVTIAGVIFGAKGLKVKDDVKKLMDDLAKLINFVLSWEGSPTADQLAIMYAMVMVLIQDAIALGDDFKTEFTPMQNRMTMKFRGMR